MDPFGGMQCMAGEEDPGRLTSKGRATRARIVEAAAGLMSRQGVAGTSIDDVRKATGMRGSQMTHYFRDKRSLVRAVIAWQADAALEVTAALETRLHELRHQLLDADRHLTGAKVLTARIYGVGPVTALALTCWLGGEGRFSSSRCPRAPPALSSGGCQVSATEANLPGKRRPPARKGHHPAFAAQTVDLA